MSSTLASPDSAALAEIRKKATHKRGLRARPDDPGSVFDVREAPAKTLFRRSNRKLDALQLVDTAAPHPSMRWITRLPLAQSGAGWRVVVPWAPKLFARDEVYDHELGGDSERAKRAAQWLRDLVASTMPLPFCAPVRQYGNGTLGPDIRRVEKANGAPAWCVWYQVLDKKTLRTKSAVVSRSVSSYGEEGARLEAEKVWRQLVLEQAALIDRLVRKGVKVPAHTLASELKSRRRPAKKKPSPKTPAKNARTP